MAGHARKGTEMIVLSQFINAPGVGNMTMVIRADLGGSIANRFV